MSIISSNYRVKLEFKHPVLYGTDTYFIPHSYLKPLNDIALIIYSDNPGQMNKYIMPTPSGASVVVEDVSGEEVER